MVKRTITARVLAAHQQHPDWTAAEIAKSLGVGGNSVRNTAHRYGLTLPRKKEITRSDGKVFKPITAEMVRAMVKMHEEGQSYATIARWFDTTEATVSRSVRGLTHTAASALGIPYEKERSRSDPIPEPEPSERTAATVHGAHLENYHRARRGFHVPGHLECKYFDLLKKGLPRAEAARKLGLLEEASS